MLYLTGLTHDKPLMYVLRGENGDLLIDTGNALTVRQLDRWIRRNNFNIKWVLLTHGHYDHTWNARYLKQKYGASVIMHEKDKSLFCAMENRPMYPTDNKHALLVHIASKLVDAHVSPFCRVDKYLTDEDGEYLKNLGFDAEIVFLPGHTAGSVGVLSENVLYAGDAVSAVKGKYNTAFFGEDLNAIYDSEKKILEMNADVIAPGHGRPIIKA